MTPLISSRFLLILLSLAMGLGASQEHQLEEDLSHQGIFGMSNGASSGLRAGDREHHPEDPITSSGPTELLSAAETRSL